MGRHLDDQLEGAAPELRDALVEVHGQAKVQAMAAKFNTYTPANSASCAILGKLCTPLHADADAKYFSQIKFWKTPISDCGNGKNDCMAYNAWQQAWTEIKG